MTGRRRGGAEDDDDDEEEEEEEEEEEKKNYTVQFCHASAWSPANDEDTIKFRSTDQQSLCVV